MTVTARFVSILLLGTLWMGAALAVTPYLVDGDGDAVSDEIDECPYTQPGVQVNRLGCPLRRDDGDVDGIVDDEDQCPYSTKGAQVDPKGCALDSDFDGIANGLDRCPSTPLAAVVTERGCAASEQPSLATKSRAAPEPAARVVLGPIPPRPEPALAATTTATTAVIAAPPAVQAEEPMLVIRFRPGSARLGSGDLALLKAYSKVFQRRLAADRSRKLRLQTTADSGEPEAETVLVARAAAVRSALTDHGLSADRITVDRQLRNTGDATANRRVEIGLGT